MKDKILQACFRIRLASGESVEEFVVLDEDPGENTCKVFQKLLENLCDKDEISGTSSLNIRSITFTKINDLKAFDYSRKALKNSKKKTTLPKGDK